MEIHIIIKRFRYFVSLLKWSIFTIFPLALMNLGMRFKFKSLSYTLISREFSRVAAGAPVGGLLLAPIGAARQISPGQNICLFLFELMFDNVLLVIFYLCPDFFRFDLPVLEIQNRRESSCQKEIAGY